MSLLYKYGKKFLGWAKNVFRVGSKLLGWEKPILKPLKKGSASLSPVKLQKQNSNLHYTCLNMG